MTQYVTVTNKQTHFRAVILLHKSFYKTVYGWTVSRVRLSMEGQTSLKFSSRHLAVIVEVSFTHLEFHTVV